VTVLGYANMTSTLAQRLDGASAKVIEHKPSDAA
jgi:hypothetical protein